MQCEGTYVHLKLQLGQGVDHTLELVIVSYMIGTAISLAPAMLHDSIFNILTVFRAQVLCYRVAINVKHTVPHNATSTIRHAVPILTDVADAVLQVPCMHYKLTPPSGSVPSQSRRLGSSSSVHSPSAHTPWRLPLTAHAASASKTTATAANNALGIVSFGDHVFTRELWLVNPYN